MGKAELVQSPGNGERERERKEEVQMRKLHQPRQGLGRACTRAGHTYLPLLDKGFRRWYICNRGVGTKPR